MKSAFLPSYGEAWTEAQFVSMMRSMGTSLITAHIEDDVVGFALQRILFDESELLLLGVRPANRGCGIGAQLLMMTRENAAGRGVNRMFLEMRDGNSAIALYQAAGFVPYHRRPRYYRGQDGQVYDAISLNLVI